MEMTLHTSLLQEDLLEVDRRHDNVLALQASDDDWEEDWEDDDEEDDDEYILDDDEDEDDEWDEEDDWEEDDEEW